MGLTDKDWQGEQQRVEGVIDHIQREIGAFEQEAGQVKLDVVQMRQHFWDEVTINLSSSDDIIETHFAIRQQAEVLSDRERRYQQAVSRLIKLNRIVHSPYFGRIDFVENGSRDVEQIYLGIASVQDEEGMFLVYDWRAPISSLYYDYAPGPVKYRAPFGEVLGVMSLKRQFQIRDGQIHLMFDAGLTIGDELLMQALSRHSDAQMTSIVATIQKTQNQIIRNHHSRMLIVQGVAGSGKTSAALQRVAYLLYKNRDSLTANQVILFSPNPLFNSYVSTVLPELGEENMEQTTFQAYLDLRLGDDFQVESPFNQLEYTLTSAGSPEYEARISGIRYKSSRDYLNLIYAYVDVLETTGMVFKSVQYGDHVIVPAERISDQFYGFHPSIRSAQRIDLMREWLQKELTVFQAAQMKEAWVEDEIELLGPEDYLRAHQQLSKQRRKQTQGRNQKRDRDATFDDFEREKEILSRMVVRRRLQPVEKWVRELQFVDVTALYRQLFACDTMYEQVSRQAEKSAIAVQKPAHWPDICTQTVTNLEQGKLFYEDATPFLFLMELVLGQRTNTAVRHVFVDEAQDYTPIQFEFMKRLFPRSRMTVLGDFNQAIYTHGSGLDDVSMLESLYGAEHTEVIRLTQSYRSTREIVEFTRGMVQGGDEIEPFNRSGEVPQVTVVADEDSLHRQIAERIAKLHSEGYALIAIICKTAVESAKAYDALKDELPVRLITEDTPTFVQETLIIPAYLAKGMEFDAVILYNGSREVYSHESERKLFYTACTRAMHTLDIFSIGAASPFIL